MNGDVSRHTFNPQKHYTTVLMQQGRIPLDADWNEQQAIHRYQLESAAIDVIGLAGAPRHNPGFQITPQGNDLLIGKGHYYVDGILCEIDQDLLFTQQPYWPGVTLSTNPGYYLAYLDVWQRHITAIEDPSIREIGLGGPDTTTRMQTIWQVRLLKITPPSGTPTASSVFPEWDTLLSQNVITATNGGKLVAQTQTATQPRYQRLENQLYRVAIHQGGTRTTARFKWSRNNGTAATPIRSITSENDAGVNRTVVMVEDIHSLFGSPIDPDLKWVELTNDVLELHQQHGILAQVHEIKRNQNQIILEHLISSQADFSQTSWHPILRRWDQRDDNALDTGLSMTGDWQPLENGIEIKFLDGTYRTGDDWLIPARAAINSETGDIQWDSPQGKLPDGTRHHLVRLAVLHQDAQGKFSSVPDGDCRKFFSALTAIADEMETLRRQRSSGAYTLLVSPSDDLAQVFASLPDGKDAYICFQVGTYTLNHPIVLKNKGHLKITGGGAGTRLVADTSEAALIVEKCPSVTVRDLYAESGTAKTAVNSQFVNGTLSFYDCANVIVEAATLKCGNNSERVRSCITVAPLVEIVEIVVNGQRRKTRVSSGKTSLVRIHGCNLDMGHQQVGILLVNAARAQVEDNLLQVTQSLPFKELLQDQRFRSYLRKFFISNIQLTAPTPTGTRPSGVNASVTVGQYSIRFQTDLSLVKEWSKLLSEVPANRIKSVRDLKTQIVKLADNLLKGEGIWNGQPRPIFVSLISSIRSQADAVAAQGIVIGGRIAEEIRIINNTIQNVLQGIHVGVSHQEATKSPCDSSDSAGVVQITGNSIRVSLPPITLRDRHGIFVGNCKSLLIENNDLTLQRFEKTATLPIEGIRLHGCLGQRIIIRHNQLSSFNKFNNFSIGITITLLQSFKAPQWVVQDNLINDTPVARIKILPESYKRLFRLGELSLADVEQSLVDLKQKLAPAFAPSPNEFWPPIAQPGIDVILFGSNLTVGNPIVRFGSLEAKVVSATDTRIVATVPDMPASPVNLSVTNVMGTATSRQKLQIPAPGTLPSFYSPQFSPKEGRPGTAVFLEFPSPPNIEAIWFNTTSASFISQGQDRGTGRYVYRVQVPAMPPGGVRISLQTPHGTVTSTEIFTVLAKPYYGYGSGTGIGDGLL